MPGADGLDGGKQGGKGQEDGEKGGEAGVDDHEVVHTVDGDGGGEAAEAAGGGGFEGEGGDADPAAASAVDEGSGEGPYQGDRQACVYGAVGGGFDNGETEAGEEACDGAYGLRTLVKAVYGPLVRGPQVRDFRLERGGAGQAGVERAQEEEYQEAAGFFGEGDLDEEFEEDGPHGGGVQWGEEALEQAGDEEGEAAAQEGV
ncbi:hypothetical protein AGMMS50267_01420 [Spirochaetia bacterium]|nr:hypothetical protein AGMMS50267_01420 [Spirochaetia bacterium]